LIHCRLLRKGSLKSAEQERIRWQVALFCSLGYGPLRPASGLIRLMQLRIPDTAAPRKKFGLPRYREVTQDLIGPETISTQPQETMDAYRDHGTRCRAVMPTYLQCQENLAAYLIMSGAPS